MINIQVASFSIEIINSELIKARINKDTKYGLNNLLNHKDVNLSVVIDDCSSPIISFYEKARVSAKIKRLYREKNVNINEVFFKYDFERLDVSAFDFFIHKEYEKNCFNDAYLKIC